MGSGSSKKAASAPASKPKQKDKAVENSAPVPKPVAFEINFEEKNKDSIIHKHPPKRLQRLEETSQMGPKLTAKMLEDKLRIAEQNRQRELDRVRSSTSASKIRRQLQDAQEQDKKEETIRGIEERQRSAGKIRNNKLKEFEDKKRENAVKAKNARERVNRLRQGVDDIEIEKDNNFFDDYDDSWDLEKDNRSKNKAAGHLSTSNNHRTSQPSQGGSTKKKSNRGSVSEDDEDFFS